MIHDGSINSYMALQPLARRGTAVSLEAQTVCSAARNVFDRARLSQALFGSKSAAESQIVGLCRVCSQPDWDPDGSAAIDPHAAIQAVRFIRALPDDLPIPEVAPEPDGSISLDWIVSRYRLFSLSIGNADQLSYAWLDGSDRGHGVAQFNGAAIPPRILSTIETIVKHDRPSFRAA